jgi:hypothetical protein
MDDRQRTQAELILKYEIDLAKRAFTSNLSAIYAKHSARGVLRSSMTIMTAMKEMGEAAQRLLRTMSEKVRPISADDEALEMLSSKMADFLDFLSEQRASIARTANVAGSSNQAMSRLFEQMRTDVEAQLTIAAFEFGSPAPEQSTSAVEIPRLKKGGRPPIGFWDDMWAAIAVALWDANLDPKSQADVERAMAAWIDANGHSASESSVRARARRLWDRMCDSKL